MESNSALVNDIFHVLYKVVPMCLFSSLVWDFVNSNKIEDEWCVLEDLFGRLCGVKVSESLQKSAWEVKKILEISKHDVVFERTKTIYINNHTANKIFTIITIYSSDSFIVTCFIWEFETQYPTVGWYIKTIQNSIYYGEIDRLDIIYGVLWTGMGNLGMWITTNCQGMLIIHP